MPRHMNLSFLRPYPAFKVGENDKKLYFTFWQFSLNFEPLRYSFDTDSGEQLDR